MKDVLVLAEVKGGEIRKVSLEAVAAARAICPEGRITATLFGPDGETHAQTLIQHGADQVILVDNEALRHYTTSGYRQALLQLIKDLNPGALIMGHTALGKDLSPRIAARLQAGLVSDVTAVEKEGDQLILTRPIYAGKAFEKREIVTSFKVITVRPNNIPPLPKEEGRSGQIQKRNIPITDLNTVIKEVVTKTAGRVDLAEARIIVAGGRGMKSADGFKILYELADVLGAAAGASRGACDAGYCDYGLQIGQTGKVVTPDLYIACGISGAIQHVAGMSNSKVIVAINKDPDAEIFKVADYGIVGDLFEVVPKLTDAFKQVITV